ncbi:stage 0 sporulation family protein [Chloroflexota bacterium]
MAGIAGIRFKKTGKVYYFDAGDLDLGVGESVVVKTSRGEEIGRVVIAPNQVVASEITEPLKEVVRKAEPEDIAQVEELEKKAEEALIECGKLVNELKLPMKLLSAEYNLEGNRVTILFGAESRVDFRELVRRLTGLLRVKVELRQVGARDEAKLVGGFGRCGRPLCCADFLCEFAPVSIKMAKEQNLPLNPMKISGLCGRLMCCLAYENQAYHEMKGKLPRTGEKVTTPLGEAEIISGNTLKQTVTVEIESGATVEIPLKDISH